MALKDMIESIGSAAGDLSTLTVETYTGTVTADIKGAEGEGTIDFDKLINVAKDEADGSVSLKLASKYFVDGDAILFVADGEISEDLRLAHDSAVNAGQLVRADLMELFSDTLKKLVSGNG